MTRKKSLILAVGLLLATSQIAQAELDQPLLDDGWDEITFDDKVENTFIANDQLTGLAREVQVNSDASVSIAFLDVDIDIDATPNLSWSWQSQTPIIDTDTTKRGGDDRTLVIYIAFPYQPDQASFTYGIRRTAIEVLRGADTPDRILTYTWGGGGARGTSVENPYTGQNGQVILLRTPDDPLGEWLNEDVNIRQDFIDAFGFEPVSPLYIGIGADSDDTVSTIRAQVRGLRFTE